MKKVDKGMQIILIIMILINPVMDLMTSVSINFDINILSIGLIIRSLILLWLFIYIIFIKKIYKNKMVIFLLSILFIYSILFTINIIINKESLIVRELIQYFKIIYFPILFIIIFFFNKILTFKIEIKHVLISIGIYSILIIIPYLTNTSFLSYSHSKVGTVGWFYAANEIGNIFAICMPFVIEYIINNENKFKYKILLFILVLISIFILGTKTPILSLVICLAIYYIFYFIKSVKEKSKYKNFIFITIVFVSILLVIPFTPFYKNIETHYQFQKVDSFKEIIMNPKKFDHFVFGERMTFLNDTKAIYDNSDLSSKLLGIGYYNQNTALEFKTIEIDFADTYFRGGPFIFIFIYFLIPIIYIIDIHKITKNNKNKLKFVLSFLLIVVISASAGHVLTAPSVTLYVIIIMILFYNSCRVVEQ